MKLPDPVQLPVCGKTATFRKLKGRDLVMAERVQTVAGSEKEYNLALLSCRVLLDGKQAILEDLLDMDEEDLDAIMGALMGPSFPESPQPA